MHRNRGKNARAHFVTNSSAHGLGPRELNNWAQTTIYGTFRLITAFRAGPLDPLIPQSDYGYPYNRLSFLKPTIFIPSALEKAAFLSRILKYNLEDMLGLITLV